jgi:hypothetical protein
MMAERYGTVEVRPLRGFAAHSQRQFETRPQKEKQLLPWENFDRKKPRCKQSNIKKKLEFRELRKLEPVTNWPLG